MTTVATSPSHPTLHQTGQNPILQPTTLRTIVNADRLQDIALAQGAHQDGVLFLHYSAINVVNTNLRISFFNGRSMIIVDNFICEFTLIGGLKHVP